MALLNFKSKQTEVPARPARDALKAHMLSITEVNAKRTSLSERDAAARRDRDAGSAAAARVSMLSAAVDQAEADVRYGAGPSGDLPSLRAQLAEAEREHATVAGIARAAAIASARYAADGAELSRQQQELSAQVPRLLFDALLEEQVARRDKFERAASELREAFCAVLEPGVAADELASKNPWEPRGGSGLFGQLVIPLVPQFQDQYDHTDTAASIAHGQRLAAEQEAHKERWLQIKARGEQLARRLLNGEQPSD